MTCVIIIDRRQFLTFALGSSEPDYDQCNHEDLNITVAKNWPAELLCHDRFNFYEEYDSFSFQVSYYCIFKHKENARFQLWRRIFDMIN